MADRIGLCELSGMERRAIVGGVGGDRGDLKGRGISSFGFVWPLSLWLKKLPNLDFFLAFCNIHRDTHQKKKTDYRFYGVPRFRRLIYLWVIDVDGLIDVCLARAQIFEGLDTRVLLPSSQPSIHPHNYAKAPLQSHVTQTNTR